MSSKIAAFIVSIMLLVSSCSLITPMERPQPEYRSLVLWMPGASSVQVIGDWNEWGGLVASGGVLDPCAGTMQRDENGFWIFDVSRLDGGVYRYSFLVNGYKWMVDGTNPLQADFMDHTVSVLMVKD